jgi:putative transposase
VWTSDITHIWTQEGWLYLSVIIDFFNRQIISWELDTSLKKGLITSALNKAIKSRVISEGLIFHSDRGVQYASNEVRKILLNNKIMQSMSAKGNCYDNAPSESFFHTLKTELVYQESYMTRKEAELSIFEYIELF